MVNLAEVEPLARLIFESDCETLDVLGPSVQFQVVVFGRYGAAEISSLRLPDDMERLQEISRFYRHEYLGRKRRAKKSLVRHLVNVDGNAQNEPADLDTAFVELIERIDFDWP